jgi:ubiquinone biosynthesis protein COQ4
MSATRGELIASGRPGAGSEERDPNAPPAMGFIAAVRYLYGILAAKEPRDHIVYGNRFMVATEGRSFVNAFARFKAHPTGRRILENRPPFLELLRDTAALAAAPPGSLARCYHEFLVTYAIGDLELDDELKAMSRGFGETEEMAWFRQRYSVMHDLRHLLTEYPPTPGGEMCLLAFRFAQTRHFGMLVLMSAAAINELLHFRPAIAGIREGYRRGRAASFLDLLEWETAPEKSVAEYQREVGLLPPVYYRSPQGAVA